MINLRKFVNNMRVWADFNDNLSCVMHCCDEMKQCGEPDSMLLICSEVCRVIGFGAVWEALEIPKAALVTRLQQVVAWRSKFVWRNLTRPTASKHSRAHTHFVCCWKRRCWKTIYSFIGRLRDSVWSTLKCAETRGRREWKSVAWVQFEECAFLTK